mmetsp:Transcript_7606/g.1032  ORF Transcript_7606/g.1032 Transcript_7606/m.1032 type:complete len:118 (+) Transcript_7606:522-875(+)
MGFKISAGEGSLKDAVTAALTDLVFKTSGTGISAVSLTNLLDVAKDTLVKLDLSLVGSELTDLSKLQTSINLCTKITHLALDVSGHKSADDAKIIPTFLVTTISVMLDISNLASGGG